MTTRLPHQLQLEHLSQHMKADQTTIAFVHNLLVDILERGLMTTEDMEHFLFSEASGTERPNAWINFNVWNILSLFVARVFPNVTKYNPQFVDQDSRQPTTVHYTGTLPHEPERSLLDRTFRAHATLWGKVPIRDVNIELHHEDGGDDDAELTDITEQLIRRLVPASGVVRVHINGVDFLRFANTSHIWFFQGGLRQVRCFDPRLEEGDHSKDIPLKVERVLQAVKIAFNGHVPMAVKRELDCHD